MILLNRIYSETGLFNEVKFHNGINIILGKYSQEPDKREVNGIGKSTLVRLIHFAFLSGQAKKIFSSEKYNFLQTHNIVLEFSIGKTAYLIKRYFESGKKDLVYFGEKNHELIEYSENELKEILENKFFLKEYDVSIPRTWFGSLMRFFIKDDINHHERADPINFVRLGVRRSTSLCYNFYLLGLSIKNIYEFDNLKEELKHLRGIKKGIEEKIKEESGKNVEELKGNVAEVESRIQKLEEALKEYKFLESYKDVENNLIKISKQISQKLRYINILKRKLEAYGESYKIEIEADLEQVERLYKEINRELGQFVKNTLEKVINFRNNIAEGRKRFLLAKENELVQTIEKFTNEITVLEEKRSKIYTLLDEEEALDSIKNTYQQLIEEKAELEKTYVFVNKLQDLEAEIAKIDLKLSEVINLIITTVKQNEERIKKMRTLFYDILKHAISVDESLTGAYFDIKASSNRQMPIDILIDIPRSESLGKSRFKILAYDLTVFFNIIQSQRNIPHFLVHDGVFHGIDKRTVVNSLNYIHSQYLRNPIFQYIITVNEDEFYIPQDKKQIYGNYNFDIEENTIVVYKDTPSKMIFKREFSGCKNAKIKI